MTRDADGWTVATDDEIAECLGRERQGSFQVETWFEQASLGMSETPLVYFLSGMVAGRFYAEREGHLKPEQVVEVVRRAVVARREAIMEGGQRR